MLQLFIACVVIVLVDLHERSRRRSGGWRAAGKCGGAGVLVSKGEQPGAMLTRLHCRRPSTPFSPFPRRRPRMPSAGAPASSPPLRATLRPARCSRRLGRLSPPLRAARRCVCLLSPFPCRPPPRRPPFPLSRFFPACRRARSAPAATRATRCRPPSPKKSREVRKEKRRRKEERTADMWVPHIFYFFY
jgi:hypothetical protein